MYCPVVIAVYTINNLKTTSIPLYESKKLLYNGMEYTRKAVGM